MIGALNLAGLRAELAEVEAELASEVAGSWNHQGLRRRRKKALVDLAFAERARYRELTGREPIQAPIRKCADCNGTGQVECVCSECDHEHETECDTCDGTGAALQEAA